MSVKVVTNSKNVAVSSKSQNATVRTEKTQSATVTRGPVGPTGPTGPMGADAHFVFEQTVSSAEWVIDHDLSKHPSVTVVDSAGSVVIGDVFFVSNSQIILEFNAEFSGKAYLN